jgi:PmbA protein
MKEIKKMKANKDTVIPPNQLLAIAKDILHEAKHQGADQAEVGISTNKGFSVSVHDGDVETVEYSQDKSIDINVYFGKRKGSASISDISPDSIRAAVSAASHIAKFTDKDPASGLAEKDELAFHFPKLELQYPWDLTVEEAIQLACECERQAKQFDPRIVSAEEASVSTGGMFHVYANSLGFSGLIPLSRHEMSCVLVAKEKEEMQRDFSYTISPDPSLLQSISHLARSAAEKTVRRLGARSLSTRKAPVIFIAEEARGLLGHFAKAITGSSLYRKSSFLIDYLDKKVFPSFVQIKEQPHLPHGLGSAPFDDDGVFTRDNVFIEDGILCQYALSVYSARKLGMKSTGNCGGMHNLTIAPGEKTLHDLLKSMGTGLLVTEMMGQGVNMITGDYSRGAAGFWVDKGEIQFSVQEITVAGNLKDMYARMVDVSNDVDLRGNIRTGSILLEEMMIAGM